jgi:uncharacterized protein YggU (UPF0235/DUF167 family)
VPKSRISIKRGESSRDKVLWIEGITSVEISERLFGA